VAGSAGQKENRDRPVNPSVDVTAIAEEMVRSRAPSAQIGLSSKEHTCHGQGWFSTAGQGQTNHFTIGIFDDVNTPA
jgi:hypothetical protein